MPSRRILIVDDDDDFRLIYRRNAKTALKELEDEGLLINAAVDVAASYDQALEILSKQPVDLLSLDIALGKTQEGQTDRLIQGDFGGIALLKKVNALGKHPLSILVSGETFSASQQAQLQQYQVLKHYHKDDPTSKIRCAIKATLIYLELVDGRQPAAQRAWQHFVGYARMADLSLDSFPSNLTDQIHV